MALYSDEQLSAILSAHAAGQLTVGGWNDFGLGCMDLYIYGGAGCINQFAFNEPDSKLALHGLGEAAKQAGSWFDSNYEPTMPARKLLAILEQF